MTKVSDGTVGADAGRNGGALRVLIVDDHEVLRTGTRQVLEASGDIVVVGEADDGNAALALIDELDPNVVLVDIRLPDRSGIDVTRHLTLTHPDVRVVILSAYDDDDFVRAALEAGATGYLLKTMARDELVAAVRAAAQGTTVLDPSLSPRLAGAHSTWGPSTGPRLTWRERETVELVAEGLSNKAIAARLGVSVRTVEGHLNHVFTKLGVESRTELVRYVLTQGLIASTPSGDPEI
jgi:DNA-binding NarL/FixJ family response regulator